MNRHFLTALSFIALTQAASAARIECTVTNVGEPPVRGTALTIQKGEEFGGPGDRYFNIGKESGKYHFDLPAGKYRKINFSDERGAELVHCTNAEGDVLRKIHLQDDKVLSLNLTLKPYQQEAGSFSVRKLAVNSVVSS